MILFEVSTGLSESLSERARQYNCSFEFGFAQSKLLYNTFNCQSRTSAVFLQVYYRILIWNEYEVERIFATQKQSFTPSPEPKADVFKMKKRV